MVDVDGVDISRSELMAHALYNAIDRPKGPEDFVVKRGSTFVNEYARTDSATGIRNDGGPSNPNHLLGAFPVLFPYGQGGFEVDRPVAVAYELHARWALRYCDQRFRKDPQFPFQVFGVCQKRQVCRSAALQMKRSAYQHNRDMIARLKPADLLKASQEETRGVPFSHPGVRALRQQIVAIRTRVSGTDEARFCAQAMIWGTIVMCNPVCIWATINPGDTQDPIAQVMAGAEVDLDAFLKTAGPDRARCAQNIAGDPYAAAKFFHFMINSLLEVVFGIKSSKGRVQRQEGVFGIVQSYIGTVEAQGRGSLHLHILFWLKDAPTASRMKEGLRDPRFRDKIKKYIASTIRADINQKSTEEVKGMEKESFVTYSRPIDPLVDRKASDEQETNLARAVQLHGCSVTTCLKVIKGRLQCKRRAPFLLAEDDWVDADGQWGPKRFSEYLNNWNPTIMRTLRANHDVKLVMSGADTRTLVWYVTNYATKKQQRSSNVSALLARRIKQHQKLERREVDVVKINKRLIQRCCNALTTDHEFSAPEIISYLMGWGDRFQSHHYVVIFWDAATLALKKAFPGLRSLYVDFISNSFQAESLMFNSN